MIAFWHKTRNFGDTLTPVILEWLTGETTIFAGKKEKGKMIAVGSIAYAIAEDDVVWGTGAIENKKINVPENVKVLALRGPLTKKVLGIDFDVEFGDPAILMPLIYNPKIEKKHKIGFVPHYVDRKLFGDDGFIDITLNWEEFIDRVLECEFIISSSLHGIIIAEAYGIPVMWRKYSDNIIGGQFKFQDYFLGTGRERQEYNKIIPPIKDLEKRQKLLIDVFKKYHEKN